MAKEMVIHPGWHDAWIGGVCSCDSTNVGSAYCDLLTPILVQSWTCLLMFGWNCILDIISRKQKQSLAAKPFSHDKCHEERWHDLRVRCHNSRQVYTRGATLHCRKNIYILWGAVRVSAVACFLTCEDRWRRLNDIAPPTAIIATCCVTVARRPCLSTCLISLHAVELHDGGA